YQKNMRVSARKYNISQLFLKWAKRNQKKVIMGVIFLAIFLGFWSYLRYQEKKEFELNLKQAKEEKALGEQEENREKKMDHLLKGLYAIDTALLMSPKHSEVAKVKLELSQSLVKSACATRDYQFAYYFVRGIERLEKIDGREKVMLKEEVDLAKTQILREHKKRLEYWKFALKQPLPGMRDDAILEISKMEEPEILEAVTQEVKEGTEYFLKSKERTSKQNEYYEMMVVALGSLENSKVGALLCESLELMAQQLLRFKEGNRPDMDVQYMVSLAQALSNAKATGFSARFGDLRRKIGENSLFSQRTEMSFRKLVLLEQLLTKLESASAQDFFYRAILKSEIKDLEGV
ncbi:MAG: hypothetical protein AABZ60_17165, partial [Planctomycetota bacterium]